MDLRQLRYFVAVAQHGSISLAAQAVYIAQPALTRQIQALEEELGATVFERSARGVRLTEVGKQLLVDANRLLGDAAATVERAQRVGRGEIGHLSIALPVMLTLRPLLTEVLRIFRHEAPGVSLTLSHLLSDTQLEWLPTGRLDAGFTLFRPPDDPAFEGIPICCWPIPPTGDGKAARPPRCATSTRWTSSGCRATPRRSGTTS